MHNRQEIHTIDGGTCTTDGELYTIDGGTDMINRRRDVCDGENIPPTEECDAASVLLAQCKEQASMTSRMG